VCTVGDEVNYCGRSESPQLSLYNKAVGRSLTEGLGRGLREKGMLG